MTPADFAGAAAAYCYVTHASVTSWGRSEAHNRSVGGVTHSAHLLFLAVDVVYTPDPTPEFTVARELAEWLGLRVIREADHDHLEPFEWGGIIGKNG